MEIPLRNGLRHGVVRHFHTSGSLSSAEPFRHGRPHGLARQWNEAGRLIGTYTMRRGTGFDLWWDQWSDGIITLSEVHPLLNGEPHGVEWWLNWDMTKVWVERHWRHGKKHGIEREWNAKDRLSRGYPKYWVDGQQVNKAKYLRTAARDPTLPPFRLVENDPRRDFPAEIAGVLYGRPEIVGKQDERDAPPRPDNPH